MEILQQMLKRAQANPQRIVLPEGDEPRTLEAANIILGDQIAELILIGDPTVIKQMAIEKGYEHILCKESAITIVDPLTNPKMPEYANLLFELRKAKGMTLEQATEKVKDPLYLGCLMIKNGDADGELAVLICAMSDEDYVQTRLRFINEGKNYEYTRTNDIRGFVGVTI